MVDPRTKDQILDNLSKGIVEDSNGGFLSNNSATLIGAAFAGLFLLGGGEGTGIMSYLLAFAAIVGGFLADSSKEGSIANWMFGSKKEEPSKDKGPQLQKDGTQQPSQVQGNTPSPNQEKLVDLSNGEHFAKGNDGKIRFLIAPDGKRLSPDLLSKGDIKEGTLLVEGSAKGNNFIITGAALAGKDGFARGADNEVKTVDISKLKGFGSFNIDRNIINLDAPQANVLNTDIVVQLRSHAKALSEVVAAQQPSVATTTTQAPEEGQKSEAGKDTTTPAAPIPETLPTVNTGSSAVTKDEKVPLNRDGVTIFMIGKDGKVVTLDEKGQIPDGTLQVTTLFKNGDAQVQHIELSKDGSFERSPQIDVRDKGIIIASNGNYFHSFDKPVQNSINKLREIANEQEQIIARQTSSYDKIDNIVDLNTANSFILNRDGERVKEPVAGGIIVALETDGKNIGNVARVTQIDDKGLGSFSFTPEEGQFVFAVNGKKQVDLSNGNSPEIPNKLKMMADSAKLACDRVGDDYTLVTYDPKNGSEIISSAVPFTSGTKNFQADGKAHCR